METQEQQEEVEYRELVVERQEAGTWAVFDSEVGDWVSVGKEGDAIKQARATAKDHDGPARLRVIAARGDDRRVKHETTYNTKQKSKKPKPPKDESAPPAPPPEPEAEPKHAPAAPKPEDPPPAGVEQAAAVQAAAEAPEPGFGKLLREHRIAKGLDVESEPWDTSAASAPVKMNAALVLVELDSDGGKPAAIDPSAVVLLKAVSDDATEVRLANGGPPFNVRGSFWDVHAQIAAARS